MGCEILDIQCLFVSEIVGNVALTIVLSLVLYFIIASKLRFGFDTTIAMLLPLVIILALMFGELPLIIAVATIFVVFLVSWIFQKITGNR